MVDEISESRNITSAIINNLADSALAMNPATSLDSLNIIDGLKYSNEMNDYLKERSKVGDKEKPRLISVSDLKRKRLQFIMLSVTSQRMGKMALRQKGWCLIL